MNCGNELKIAVENLKDLLKEAFKSRQGILNLLPHVLEECSDQLNS